MKLYVVGEQIAETECGQVVWALVGVFDDEQKAMDALENDQQFIGPVTLNEPLPLEIWPGCYYPLLEEGH